MTHVPEYSAQCLIGKCGVCPDPDCEHHCHPSPRTAPLDELELLLGGDRTTASETEN